MLITRPLALTESGEEYKLLNHSARPLGRYDVVKDIRRLEQLVSTHRNMIGYAILLTNDSDYWSLPKSSSTIDDAFRLHEGSTLQGSLSWGQEAGGTTKGREAPIDLMGVYELHWSDYSQVEANKSGKFRYLSVKVSSQDRLEVRRGNGR